MKTITSVAKMNQYIASSINPLNYPDTTYELYSVPSFDAQYPEIIKGTEIGSTKITVEPGDVLICKINPRINRVWVVEHHTEHQLLASSEWIVVRNPNMDSNYLKWYFSSPSFRNLITSQVAGIGGSLTRAQPKQVAQYPVPIVPYDEQKKIAANLTLVDDLISLQRQQFSKIDELLKSRFIELFAKYENSFSVTTVGEISEMVTVGIANSATHAYAEDGIIMFRNQNIKEGLLDDSDLIFITPEFANKYKTKALKENDLLITRTGYPGIACIVPKKYEGCQTFTTLIVRLRKDNAIRPQYVCSYINSIFGKKYVDDTKVGVAQQNFGAKVLDKMPIFIPPVEEQILFEQFVEQTDKLKFEVKQSLEKMEILKKSLMQEYFG